MYYGNHPELHSSCPLYTPLDYIMSVGESTREKDIIGVRDIIGAHDIVGAWIRRLKCRGEDT